MMKHRADQPERTTAPVRTEKHEWQSRVRLSCRTSARMLGMTPTEIAEMARQWKASRATLALAKFWERNAPEGTSFDEPEAVAMVMVTLECYEMALQRIGHGDGSQAEIAKAALSFKPLVWR